MVCIIAFFSYKRMILAGGEDDEKAKVQSTDGSGTL